MNKTISKGSCNYLIQEAVDKGLCLKNGVLFLPNGKPAKIRRASHGYNIISLGPVNKRRSFTVARIICWLVYGPPPCKSSQVDHINRIRHDDRPENLRWVSASHNAKNVSESSKIKRQMNCFLPRKRYKGGECPWAKLTKHQVEEIRQCTLTQNQAAKKFQVSQSTVSRIRNAKSWA